MPVALCVFDAYGTLFDVAAAARAAAEEPGGERLATAWPRLADTWRTKQLTYTWLRSLAGDHADLWTITRDALDYALEDQGMADDLALRGRLMALYRELPAFPEAPGMLAALKAGGMRSVILSNGSPGMLESPACPRRRRFSSAPTAGTRPAPPASASRRYGSTAPARPRTCCRGGLPMSPRTSPPPPGSRWHDPRRVLDRAGRRAPALP